MESARRTAAEHTVVDVRKTLATSVIIVVNARRAVVDAGNEGE